MRDAKSLTKRARKTAKRIRDAARSELGRSFAKWCAGPPPGMPEAEREQKRAELAELLRTADVGIDVPEYHAFRIYLDDEERERYS